MSFICLPFEESLQTPDRFLVIRFTYQVVQILFFGMSVIIIFAHDTFMHAFVISLVRTILRVLSKYSPGLLIWPDVDEADLMDEEFDSEVDA